MIITIDGSVGTGKSTVAKKLAKTLGYIYFDTGAMYRAITWAIQEKKIDIHDEAALAEFLKTFEYDIKVKMGEKSYFVGEEDVTHAIRKPEISAAVSEVAAVPLVRESLVPIQRELALGVNAIFEGRDMGTVVFPDADLKIFLTGDAKVRAERRFKELIQKFPELKETLTLDQVLDQINKRDEYDSTRETSPLKQADDACIIDTTPLTPDEVVYKILEYRDTIKKKRN